MRTQLLRDAEVDWKYRWIGGFCPLGSGGGLAIRHADYQAHPSFEQILPVGNAVTDSISTSDLLTAWSKTLNLARILLVKSPQRARELLMKAANIHEGDHIGLPANASQALVESVKRVGGKPCFYELNELLQGRDADSNTIVWSQTIAGIYIPHQNAVWLDAEDTLPIPGTHTNPSITVAVYGLRLSADKTQSGALIVFGTGVDDLYNAVSSQISDHDLPDPILTEVQRRRLIEFSVHQRRALAETYRGLDEAAGLPLLPISDYGPLPHGIALRIPDETHAATFFAYIRAENTPIRWFPELASIHYAAWRGVGNSAKSRTAEHLTRWLLVPVGPTYTDEEIKHSILGVVKAAEYLGVRWYTHPAWAAEYAAILTQTYGNEHDAYRPAFSINYR